MPESKHHKKGKSHSTWRKARNIRRSQARYSQALEKRGMKQAMKMMTQEVEKQEMAPFERVENNPEKVHDYYEDQVGEK